MEQDLTIAPLTAALRARMQGWSSPSAQGLLLKLPTVLSEPDVLGWAGMIGQEPVALCTVSEDNEGNHYLYIIVKPSERNKGYGNTLFSQILDLAEIKQLRKLRTATEPSNTAARKIIERHGFSYIGNTPDGLLEFEHH